MVKVDGLIRQHICFYDQILLASYLKIAKLVLNAWAENAGPPIGPKVHKVQHKTTENRDGSVRGFSMPNYMAIMQIRQIIECKS